MQISPLKKLRNQNPNSKIRRQIQPNTINGDTNDAKPIFFCLRRKQNANPEEEIALAMVKFENQKRLSSEEFLKVYDALRQEGPVAKHQNPDTGIRHLQATNNYCYSSENKPFFTFQQTIFPNQPTNSLSSQPVDLGIPHLFFNNAKPQTKNITCRMVPQGEHNCSSGRDKNTLSNPE